MNNQQLNDDNFIPDDLLKRWPGHLHPELLPEDVSLHFEMTANNLFAVWYVPTEHQKLIMNNKGPSIKQDWCLADLENPLKQIQKFYGNMNVLAVVPLSELASLHHRIEKPGFWRTLISSSKVYFVEENKKQWWSQKKTGSVLFEGDISDIHVVLQNGQSILNNKEYQKVTDARGVQEGHPNDWLTFMIDAKDGSFFREEELKYLGDNN